MPNLVHDLSRTTIDGTLARLIDNLVNIKDATGEFLLRLDDGRVIDTKGWNDWEWTHGIGLYAAGEGEARFKNFKFRAL